MEEVTNSDIIAPIAPEGSIMSTLIILDLQEYQENFQG